MYKLYLDDIRTPRGEEWVVVRSFEEFKRTILERGAPKFISFDHDLGWDTANDTELPSGYDCAKWIVENNIVIKGFFVHSANPVGAENITRLLENYRKHVLKNL